MNRRFFVAVLIAGTALGLAGPVSAQIGPNPIHPGYRYPIYSYGGWSAALPSYGYPGYAYLGNGYVGVNGSAASPGYGFGGAIGSNTLLGPNYRQPTAPQSLQAGQEAAMGQNNAGQSGIHNTLSNPAQGQTNAILSQQQANQDWWFQQQSQQMAQRRAMELERGAPAAAAGFAPAGKPPAAAMDIIQWPTVLREAGFASARARIEAPYRHTSPNLTIPRASDYQQMATAVEDMKAALEWRLRDGIATADYNAATSFLNRLGVEIAARARAAGSSN